MKNNKHSAEEIVRKERIKVLKRLFLILGAIGIVMSFVRYATGDIRQAVADVLLSVTVLLSRQLLIRSESYYLPVVRFAFLSVIAASFHIVLYQESPIRFIWLTTGIYFIFYVFPRKEAYVWLAFIAALAVYIGAFHLESTGINGVEYVLWVINISFVVMISKWYIDVERSSIERLRSAEEELRREVRNKTLELKRKTEALEELNATLEEKIARKVEENREQEQMLHRQARYAQMGEMLNMIAHQWRQPLHAVSITTYTLEKKIRDRQCEPEEMLTYLARIGDYTKHLSQTIEDFRHFFKFEKEKKVVPLVTIVNDALEIMEPIFERYAIRCTRVCNEKIALSTYPNEVLHALLNVLRNAQEAFVENRIEDRRIEITGLRQENFALIRIEDNAGGVPEEIRDKIFEPYFTTKDQDGTGLGLYMTKQLIERHCGGTIRFETSENGTIFYIELPLARSDS
jgi:signal transduction histidine kinase